MKFNIETNKSNPKEVELAIKQFDNQIEDMHRNIRMHVLDKSKYPRPQFEGLILSILEFHIPGLVNRAHSAMLENIKHKASLRATVWRRWLKKA